LLGLELDGEEDGVGREAGAGAGAGVERGALNEGAGAGAGRLICGVDAGAEGRGATLGAGVLDRCEGNEKDDRGLLSGCELRVAGVEICGLENSRCGTLGRE
jgi:hypothetical protein